MFDYGGRLGRRAFTAGRGRSTSNVLPIGGSAAGGSERPLLPTTCSVVQLLSEAFQTLPSKDFSSFSFAWEIDHFGVNANHTKPFGTWSNRERSQSIEHHWQRPYRRMRGRAKKLTLYGELGTLRSWRVVSLVILDPDFNGKGLVRKQLRSVFLGSCLADIAFDLA